MAEQDTPFTLRGGETEQSSLYNRINAINRVKFLSGVDLSTKSKYFLFAMDMEMYQRWYKNYPKDHKIDEEWCQRAAEVAKALDANSEYYTKAVELAGKVAVEFEEYKKEPEKK